MLERRQNYLLVERNDSRRGLDRRLWPLCIGRKIAGFGRMCLQLPAKGLSRETLDQYDRRTDLDEDEAGSICFYLGPIDVRLVARNIAPFGLCTLLKRSGNRRCDAEDACGDC